MRLVLFLAVFMSASLCTLEAQEYLDKNWKRCPESKAKYVAEGIDSLPGSYIVRTKTAEGLSMNYSIYTTADFRNGKMVSFSSKGDTLVVCGYVDGMIHGAYKQNLAGHGLYKKAQYQRGKEEGTTEYYFPNGQISARYQMKKGKVKSSEFWNSDGSVVKDISTANYDAKLEHEGYPSFSKWVASMLEYPQLCREKKIEGTVYCRFLITKEGKLVDVEIVESPHYLMTAQAIRILENSPVWKPAKRHNQIIGVRHTFPVIFQLKAYGAGSHR